MRHHKRVAISFGDVVSRRKRAQHLLAHALDRVGIEARRVEREPQQFEALVSAFAQHAQRAAEIIALHAKSKFDRRAIHALLEGA